MSRPITPPVRCSASSRDYALDRGVGRRVRLRREEIGLTVQALAHATDVTVATMGRYEAGAERIGVARLTTIADTLGVEPSYFFVAEGDACPDADPANAIIMP